MTSSPKRRWFRFSLRTLFIAMTVFCLWLGWNVQIVHERNAMRHKIRRDGGWVVIENPAKGPDIAQGPVNDEGTEIPDHVFRVFDIETDGVNPIPLVRRMLGDEFVVMVRVKRESEVESVQRIFPGCLIDVERSPQSPEHLETQPLDRP